MKRSLVFTAVVAFFLSPACRDGGLEPSRQEPSQNPSQNAVVIDTGYIMRNGTPVRVVFEIRDGLAIFQGDINLGPSESIARTLDELLNRAPLRTPTGVAIDGHRWINGVVPYVIESSFPDPQRAQDAMTHIRARAGGISFQTKGSWDSDYIVFRRTTDPSICGRSDIGKTGGAQDILVGDGCGVGSVVHELGHALGFWHEQSRCDRDNYVEILWDNIDELSHWFQFTKQCDGSTDYESYDESSIMHYPPTAFGKIVNQQQLQTIRSLRGLDNLMGQSDSLSTIDIFTVDRMYQPYGPYIFSITNQNGNPLLTWAHSGRAIAYYVGGVRTYEEWNDYAGTYYSYDENIPIGCSSSGLSCVDTYSPFTGNSLCTVWNYHDGSGSADYRYYYTIVAYFANGVWSTVERQEAPVAPSDAPCPDFQPQ